MKSRMARPEDGEEEEQFEDYHVIEEELKYMQVEAKEF